MHTPRSGGKRNRSRQGRHAYFAAGKAPSRDTYGEWQNGRQVIADKIAGKTLVIKAPPQIDAGTVNGRRRPA